MTRLTTCLAAAFLAGGLFATPALAEKQAAKQPGVLHVYGNNDAKLFTDAGIKRAESALANTQFDHGLTVTLDLYAKLPDGKSVPADEAGKQKFFHDWALERATADKAKGVYVLVSRTGGWVEVLVDKTTRDRGFSKENEKHLHDTLRNGFRAAKDKPESEQFAIRDKALLDAVSFVSADLKDTTVSATTSNTKTEAGKKPGGLSVGNWICLGLCVLLGVWLVIGLIRAFTGAGGGGGYGGGGGGFGSSLLGGLFGAMAGMWLYNSMFGGGGMFGGSDAHAGEAGTSGDTGASGDGDFSGDTGTGGSYDGGGGGDFGGGGGDFGGDF